MLVVDPEAWLRKANEEVEGLATRAMPRATQAAAIRAAVTQAAATRAASNKTYTWHTRAHLAT